MHSETASHWPAQHMYSPDSQEDVDGSIQPQDFISTYACEACRHGHTMASKYLQ